MSPLVGRIYGGVAIQGAYCRIRDDVNTKFYGYPVKASKIINGEIPPPPAAQPLYEALEEYRRWVTGLAAFEQATAATAQGAAADQESEATCVEASV